MPSNISDELQEEDGIANANEEGESNKQTSYKRTGIERRLWERLMFDDREYSAKVVFLTQVAESH